MSNSVRVVGGQYIECPPCPPKEDTVTISKEKLEALELVVAYADDVVKAWPNLSFRTLRTMIPKMETLKQAIESAK